MFDQVRPWQSHDLLAIEQIEADQGFSRWSLKQLEESMLNHQGFVFENGEVIAGFAIFSVLLDEIELLAITFLGGYQGQGLAARLLRTCLSSYKTQDIETCFLEVGEHNQAAITLYQHLGFKRVGLRKNYYRAQQPAQDALIYRLSLSSK